MKGLKIIMMNKIINYQMLKIGKLDQKLKPINDGWFTGEEKELDEERELDDLPPLEGDEEELKEGKRD